MVNLLLAFVSGYSTEDANEQHILGLRVSNRTPSGCSLSLPLPGPDAKGTKPPDRKFPRGILSPPLGSCAVGSPPVAEGNRRVSFLPRLVPGVVAALLGPRPRRGKGVQVRARAKGRGPRGRHGRPTGRGTGTPRTGTPRTAMRRRYVGATSPPPAGIVADGAPVPSVHHMLTQGLAFFIKRALFDSLGLLIMILNGKKGKTKPHRLTRGEERSSQRRFDPSYARCRTTDVRFFMLSDCF